MLDFDKALSQSPLSPKLAQSEGAADKPSAETAEHKRAADSKTLNLKSFDTFLTDIAAAPETLDTHSKETHGFAKGHTSQNVQTPIIDHDRIDHDLETFHAVELNLTAEPSLENSALASIDLPKAGAPTIDMPTLEHHRHADPVGVKTAPLEIDMPRLDHDRLPSAQGVTEIDMPRLDHDRLPSAQSVTEIDMPRLNHDRLPAAATSTPSRLKLICQP